METKMEEMINEEEVMNTEEVLIKEEELTEATPKKKMGLKKKLIIAGAVLGGLVIGAVLMSKKDKNEPGSEDSKDEINLLGTAEKDEPMVSTETTEEHEDSSEATTTVIIC